MRNQTTMLLAFLAAFMFISPALAAPPDEAKAEETAAEAGAPADEAETDDAKASEGGASEGGASEGGASEGGTSGGDTEGPAEIEDDAEAASVVKQLVGAAKGGHWGLVGAFVIMLLVYAAKRLGLADKLGSKFVPWYAAGTGMAGYVAAGLLVEGTSMVDAVTGGILVGAAAVGLWELLFKHLMSGAKSEGDEDS